MMSEVAPDPWAYQRWAFEVRAGNPARKAVLMTLAGMADAHSGRCEARVSTISQATEISERTVREHLGRLVEMGLIARRAQWRVDGGRRNDEFLLLAPWVSEWPDGTPVENPNAPSRDGTPLREPHPPLREPQAPPATAAGQELPVGTKQVGIARARARAREAAQSIPEDFPAQLRPHARIVMRVLQGVAEQHAAKEVTPRAVALAMMAHPRHPLVRTAFELASWAADPPRPIRDVVATYRTWLSRTSPLARTEPLPDEPFPVSTSAPNAGGPRSVQNRRDEMTAKLLAQREAAIRAEAERGGVA